MISETRRRAYLDAMQVASWLPRTAAVRCPSRLELLQPPVAEPEPAAAVAPVAEVEAAPVVERPAVTPTVEPTPAPRPRIAMPEPKPVAATDSPGEAAAEPAKAIEPPPRFSLQLLRAGNVLLVVELPTGESFQSRDPAYILLRTCCAPPGCRTSRSRSAATDPLASAAQGQP